MNLLHYITQHFFRNPTRVAVTSFMLLVSTGSILLKLPWATNPGHISWVDAIFTATSACSVTGLGVLDTGTYFTFAGQLIILLLVQVGGVGIMTFSTLFILMSGRKPGIVGGQTIKDTYTQTGERHPAEILKDVLLFTLFIEALGAALLFVRFAQEYPLPKAVFLSIFHSICAFCNAGFSLFSNSLIAYRGDWLVSLTIGGLIILGGLGFLVFSDIKRAILSPNRFWKEVSLQSKVVVTATIIILVASTVILLWMERNYTLTGLPLNEKILASFFQSVTARTAGFNTVDIGAMANESLLFMIVLMFIGAGPGSTAGGVKITTASVLVLLGLAHLNGEERPHMFFRSISKATLGKAVSTVLLSVIVLVGIVILLQISEEGNPFLPSGHAKFLDLSFETVSAFGTVGLSTGITGKLSASGKLILSIMMIIGKLGMLTLALAISHRRMKKFYYSEENIMIG
ncbi:MAG: hypothetical protein HQL20_00960 [Candidatus Omnitrophica bacterium]|nr:hypothetical protein [Candidatus Omnitrophota bacterium]